MGVQYIPGTVAHPTEEDAQRDSIPFDRPADPRDARLEGMPYSYNKAALDHPDMREFVEKVWGASCRKDARIAEMEAESKSILGEAQHIASYLRRIAELEAALQEIASLPTRDANGQKDRASIDVLTGGDAIRLARAALSTKEAKK